MRYAARYGRWLTHRGHRIRMHRSMRVLAFPKRRWLEVALLPVAFNILTFLALDVLTGFWTDFFSFWLLHLQLPGEVVQTAQYHFWGRTVSIPSLLMSDAMPTSTGWTLHAAVTLIVLALSVWIPDRYLPMRYLLRALVAIHTTALLYFAFVPASFPYDLQTYIRDSLITMIVFLLILPWLLAFTYYIYDFSIARKAGVTLLMIAYFSVFAVTQLLVHAICLHTMSVLMLPLLYLIFGEFLNVMLFMALYGWAMSM
jgi:hypothetical protein